MRLLIHILLVTGFIIIPIISSAQDDGVPTVSRDCYPAAKAKAQALISGPQLTAVASFPFDTSGFFVKSRFDFTTGRASIWIFTFRSELNRDPALVITYKSKSTGNCVALPGPMDDTSKIAHDDMDDSRIDSDSLMLAISKNSTFLSLYVQHPEIRGDTVFEVSSNGEDFKEYPPNANLWVITFGFTGGSLLCAYDATNRTPSECMAVLSSVEGDDVGKDQPRVAPGPANTVAFLTVPDIILQSLREIRIYDLQGHEYLSNVNLMHSLVKNVVVVPAGLLNSGLYMIRVTSNEKSYTVPMMVEH